MLLGRMKTLSPLCKTQMEVVLTHNEINRTCKDDPTWYGTRREKDRQTEKEMGRYYIRMDRIRVE